MTPGVRAPFVVRHAYFFGGLGTGMIGDLVFGLTWWKALLIALPTFIAGELVRDSDVS